MSDISDDLEYSLIDAVRHGRIDDTRVLIDSYGLSYLPNWSDGYTLLVEALKNGHPEIAKLLITSGSRVNRINQDISDTPHVFYLDPNGLSPLHIAVKRCYIDIVEMLLDNGAKIDAKTDSGETPLQSAAIYSDWNIELIELLLNRGADVNVSDNDGFSLLHFAVRNSYNDTDQFAVRNSYNDTDQQIVEHLLKHGAYINSVVNNGCKKGYTPLHMSVENGNQKLSSLLINNGADINFKRENNITPLHIASMKGYAHIVQDLLNHGACTDSITLEQGYTPLMIAINSRKKTVVQLLLQHITNIDSQDKDGCTILNLAVKSQSLMIVKDVLKHFPDINNQSNKSSLKTAVLDLKKYRKESRNIVYALLEYGLTFNPNDANDPNLLIAAVQHGFVKIIDMLILIFDADINSTDEDGTTLLDIAIDNKQVKLVNLLLGYGYDINIATKWNKTPLNRVIEMLSDRRVQHDTFSIDSFRLKLKFIAKALRYHIIKTKIANLHVNDKDLSLIDLRFYIPFQSKCMIEIESMKSEKIINTNISFYDILTKSTNSLEMYMRNENIVKVLKSGDYETKFPVYASMIKNSFRKSMERKKLVEHGLTIVHSLFKNYPLLPYICAEKILSFLDNKDIKTLLYLQPSSSYTSLTV